MLVHACGEAQLCVFVCVGSCSSVLHTLLIVLHIHIQFMLLCICTMYDHVDNAFSFPSHCSYPSLENYKILHVCSSLLMRGVSEPIYTYM